MKAGHVGYTCVGAGFVAALIALAVGGPAIVAMHLLLGAFALGTLLDGGVSVYLYERGVRNA